MGNFLIVKLDFVLQPALNWSKEKSKEEQQLIDYSNLFFKEKTVDFEKFFTLRNYEHFKNLCEKLAKKKQYFFPRLE